MICPNCKSVMAILIHEKVEDIMVYRGICPHCGRRGKFAMDEAEARRNWEDTG